MSERERIIRAEYREAVECRDDIPGHDAHSYVGELLGIIDELRGAPSTADLAQVCYDLQDERRVEDDYTEGWVDGCGVAGDAVAEAVIKFDASAPEPHGCPTPGACSAVATGRSGPALCTSSEVREAVEALQKHERQMHCAPPYPRIRGSEVERKLLDLLHTARLRDESEVREDERGLIAARLSYMGADVQGVRRAMVTVPKRESEVRAEVEEPVREGLRSVGYRSDGPLRKVVLCAVQAARDRAPKACQDIVDAVITAIDAIAPASTGGTLAERFDAAVVAVRAEALKPVREALLAAGHCGDGDVAAMVVRAIALAKHYSERLLADAIQDTCAVVDGVAPESAGTLAGRTTAALAKVHTEGAEWMRERIVDAIDHIGSVGVTTVGEVLAEVWQAIRALPTEREKEASPPRGTLTVAGEHDGAGVPLEELDDDT